MKKITRNQLGVFILLFSIAITLLLGLVFALLPAEGKSYLEKLSFFVGFFAAFCGGPGIVTAILLLVTKIHDSLAMGFGLGMWFGFCAVYMAMIEWFGMTETGAASLGAIIVCLTAALLWEKHFKPQYEE